jgi:prevent-host-death family protein
MDVAVSDLRAHLSDWLDRVRAGDDVVITERGMPVARLVGVDWEPVLERLVREGKVSRPIRTERPVARSRNRPRARRSIADIVSEQRG